MRTIGWIFKSIGFTVLGGIFIALWLAVQAIAWLVFSPTIIPYANIGVMIMMALAFYVERPAAGFIASQAIVFYVTFLVVEWWQGPDTGTMIYLLSTICLALAFAGAAYSRIKEEAAHLTGHLEI